MGKNSLSTILVGLLLLSAIASAVLAFMYVRGVGQFRALQPQVNYVGQQQNIGRALVGELLEYSKTHPDINPVLESAGIKQAPGAAATPKK